MTDNLYQFEAPPKASLKGGGPGDTFDGMEQRVAALEAGMKEVQADMKKVLAELSYLRGKIDSVPTTLQLMGFVVAIFAASGLTRYFGH
jgi:excinuclease UvrABC helicase subunit UvrB